MGVMIPVLLMSISITTLLLVSVVSCCLYRNIKPILLYSVIESSFWRIFKDYWCTKLFPFTFCSDLACNKISKVSYSTSTHKNDSLKKMKLPTASKN